MARWRAVARGPDALVFSDLIAGLPAALRAEPSSEDAGELITSALDVLTDAAVRGRLPHETPMLPARRGRKPLQPGAGEGTFPTYRASMASAVATATAACASSAVAGVPPSSEVLSSFSDSCMVFERSLAVTLSSEYQEGATWTYPVPLRAESVVGPRPG